MSASPERIRQVRLNLTGNALKYTREGAAYVALTVLPSETAPCVRVAITDTGIGIPASALPYVFDNFYRVTSRATRHIEGTGLGLAITRSLVESHGGRIWAESVEGQGSTFAFTLPLAG